MNNYLVVSEVTDVVAALIWDKDKFMICQRPAHKARALLWEFVGGKMEPGETKEQALVRECREELAVTLSVAYFKSYYEGRRTAGLPVEKKNSIFAKGGYTDKEAERNILSNPFKRFEDMQMLRHTKTLGIVQVDEAVWKRLSKEEKAEIEEICDEKLTQYFSRIK